MSLTTVLALARDLAGLATASLLILAAAAALSGAAGLGGALAANLATVAASGLITLGLFGAAAAFVDAPLSALLWAIGALAVIGGFASAQLWGVRGLWLMTLAVIGALIAALIVWTFMRHLGRPIGPTAPLIAAGLLALTAFGALGVAMRGAKPATASAEVGAPRLWTEARALFATPPLWFDCTYATLGGTGVQPGFCAFRPPKPVEVAAGPMPAAAPAALSDRALGTGASASDRGAQSIAAPVRPGQTSGPPAAVVPAPPAAETPEFAPLRADEDAAPPTPDRLGPAPRETPPAAPPSGSDATASAAEAPTLRPASKPVVSAPVAENAPPKPIGPQGANLRVAPAGAASDAPKADPAPTRAAASGERRRSEFICFAMPGGLADQLCPDDRLNARDVSVRWLGAGGEAAAAIDRVDCVAAPNLALHATLLIELSGSMASSIPAHAGPSARVRKIDAVYEMMTRLIVGARAIGEAGGEDTQLSLHLSTYFAGGSRLLSPWASQQFGDGKADRLFDVRSTRQTLALVRRLQSEAQSLRRTAAAQDLIETLASVIVERPEDPGPAAQGLVVAAVDARAAEALDAAQLSVLAERFVTARLPLYVLVIGSETTTPALQRAAERTGGGAFAAMTAAELGDAIDRLLLRTQNFCSLRVTAPESFYDQGGVEVRLRRRLLDGCVFEQVATLSCQGVSLQDRVLKPQR